jgi:hypothetical protein
MGYPFLLDSGCLVRLSTSYKLLFYFRVLYTSACVAGRAGNETNVSLHGATRVEAGGSRPAEEEDVKLDKNTKYGSSDRAYHIPARYRRPS